MDPNAALERIREILARSDADYASDHEERADFEELAQLVSGLDDWMVQGGFLPDEWATNRPAPLATGTHPLPIADPTSDGVGDAYRLRLIVEDHFGWPRIRLEPDGCDLMGDEPGSYVLRRRGA